jgi:hypothetical protein
MMRIIQMQMIRRRRRRPAELEIEWHTRAWDIPWTTPIPKTTIVVAPAAAAAIMMTMMPMTTLPTRVLTQTRIVLSSRHSLPSAFE